MMEGQAGGLLCLGSICLAPLVAFVVGVLVGKNKLPFRVKIERNESTTAFEVDDGTTAKWK